MKPIEVVANAQDARFRALVKAGHGYSRGDFVGLFEEVEGTSDPIPLALGVIVRAGENSVDIHVERGSNLKRTPTQVGPVPPDHRVGKQIGKVQGTNERGLFILDVGEAQEVREGDFFRVLGDAYPNAESLSGGGLGRRIVGLLEVVRVESLVSFRPTRSSVGPAATPKSSATASHCASSPGLRLRANRCRRGASSRPTRMTCRATGRRSITPSESAGACATPPMDIWKRSSTRGNTVTYAYDGMGRMTSTRAASGGGVETLTTTYVLDELGRATSTTHPDGSTSSVEYDGRGKMTARVDRRGHRTAYTYDPLGQQTRIDHPDGTFETTAYDGEGRVTSRTDAAGRTRVTTYDALGRQATVTFVGETTTFGYDLAGRMTSVTNARGEVTTLGRAALLNGNRTSLLNRYRTRCSRLTAYSPEELWHVGCSCWRS